MNSFYKPNEEESMKAPVRSKDDYEKVKVGEFICGVIEKIEYDMEHKFTYKGVDKIAAAVRIVFKLDGYAFPHRSRWMNFNVGEKSNLYKRYLAKLVEDAQPDMSFDFDQLEGMRVKTIWEESNDFQSIESIFPEGKKIVPMDPEPEYEEPNPIRDEVEEDR
jgi:hypothetical protein